MSDETSPHDTDSRAFGWRRAVAAALGLVVAVALVALISVVSLSNRQRDAALTAQRHSFEVMILARTLESTITRSEAALGRFVISGNKQVGRYYYDQWRRAGYLIGRLEDVTRDNARQTEQLHELRKIYLQRGRELSATALRTNYGQGWNALSKYYQAGQAKSLEQISGSLDRIIETERRVLDHRTGAAARSIERSNRLAWVLSVVGILVVLGAVALGFTTINAIAQRRIARRDVDDVARRADELEEAVADRTAELSEAYARLLDEAAEREHAEAQLRQIQKMEAVGQLTGGIAHDFNNMLAVVVGGLELAKRRVRDGSEDPTRHIDNAMEGATRAAALTRRLLAFARSEPLLPEAVTPEGLIGGMTDLLDRTLGERIQVKTDCASGHWKIWVDRHQLENALLNLAVNARDAMDGEGRLTIAVENRSIASGEAGEAPAGDYVSISVIDDGCGMTEDVMERVFEPFFTTKPVGKGTGLGLSQIFGFVRQSHGEIEIVSTPGEGTKVSLLLPRYTDAGSSEPVAANDQETEDAPAPRNQGQQRILVVEDDPRVLIATVEALVELGHRPVPCPSPDDAAALMANHPDIRLILSDVVMPGTTGPALVASLKPLYPHVGVLFVTGFAGEVEEAGSFGGHDVLRKPFTINALSAAVDDALRKANAPIRFEAIAATG